MIKHVGDGTSDIEMALPKILSHSMAKSVPFIGGFVPFNGSNRPIHWRILSHSLADFVPPNGSALPVHWQDISGNILWRQYTPGIYTQLATFCQVLQRSPSSTP